MNCKVSTCEPADVDQVKGAMCECVEFKVSILSEHLYFTITVVRTDSTVLKNAAFPLQKTEYGSKKNPQQFTQKAPDPVCCK